MNGITKGSFDFFLPLVCEWDEKYQEFSLSLGRCAFWIVLGVAVGRFWFQGNEIPANLFWALGALLTYNIGKQIPGVVLDVKLNGGPKSKVGQGDATPKGGQGDATKA